MLRHPTPLFVRPGMNRLRKTWLAAALLAAIAILVSASSARADMFLQLSDGTTTITILDNGKNDGSPTAGVIVFNGTIGNFTVNVSVGTSTRGSGLGQIDLNSINVLNSGSGTLTITLADTGFNIGSPKGVMTS